MTRGRVVLFSCIAAFGITPLLAQTVTDPALRVETDFAVKVCDGHPSDVESDKPYWFGIGCCPWRARVIAVEDSR